jgi:hypothetical protein
MRAVLLTLRITFYRFRTPGPDFAKCGQNARGVDAVRADVYH